MVLARMKEQNMADDPPYSRLFVVYNRKDPLSEAELRNDFAPYGDVQDIFMVKDKGTGESKGTYNITYSLLILNPFHKFVFMHRCCLCEIS